MSTNIQTEINVQAKCSDGLTPMILLKMDFRKNVGLCLVYARCYSACILHNCQLTQRKTSEQTTSFQYFLFIAHDSHHPWPSYYNRSATCMSHVWPGYAQTNHEMHPSQSRTCMSCKVIDFVWVELTSWYPSLVPKTLTHIDCIFAHI